LKHYIRGQRFSKKPVDIRSEKNRNEAEIPFVNHNPHTFKKQRVKAGFEIDRVLSVSNLRSGTIKKLVPHKLMMITENLLQPTLAGTFFGPSIFFLVRKAK
jgi:hypothetical protein